MAAARLAKLSPPRASNWVPRQRLHRLLDEVTRRAVVWIAAEPGAGKSTLAAAWAASRTGRVLWFRADAGDADPGAAFSYFTELARSGRRAPAVPAYQPHDLERLDLFARAFFRAFFAVVPAAATLVIDDAHAAAATDFDVLLAAAIDEAPADIAFLVLSRKEPSGPLLDAVARGALDLIQSDALAFTSDEAIDLLSDRVDKVQARRLQAQAGGWAAGLLMLAQDSSGEFGSGTKARERVDTFFAERVLSPLTDEQRRTLAAASLLPDVDVAGLHQLGFGDAAAETLERLRKLHTFVMRLDREPPSWRLHDLLREALRKRFDGIGDAAWRLGLQRNAAQLAACRGLAREAVQLLLDAGDAAAARSMAERMAHELVASRRLAELDAVAAALGEQVEDSVALLIALAESAWQRNDSREAVTRFERAFARLNPSSASAPGLLIAASALGAILEGWQDYRDTERWVRRLAGQLAARASIDDVNERLRIDSVRLRAMDLVWGADLGDREVLIVGVLEALRQRNGPIDPNEAIAASAVLLESAGYRLSDENLFRDVVEATAPWLQRIELAPLAKAGWLNTYAPLGRRWPTAGVKLPATDPVSCLELAVGIAREHGGRSIAFSGSMYLAQLAVADNDSAAARRRLAALREVADPNHPAQSVNLLVVEGSVLALERDWPRAEAALQRALELARRHAFPPSERWSLELTLARIAIAAGRAEEARTTLLQASARYEPGMRRDFALILADVAVAAQALRADGRIPDELVASILQRARQYAWPGFATLLAPVAARICAAALRLGVESEFARQVVQERHLAAPSPYEPNWPWPIRVHALGSLRVEVDGQTLAFGPRAQRKPIDLLKVLIAHGPAPVDTAIVLDALWPDAEGGAARASFDMTLMRLRKLLGRDNALHLDAGRVGLDPGCVWVDAFAFAHGAIDNYPGPLFGADAVESWWAAARERLHQRYLRRTLERGSAVERAGQHEAALAIYEAGLAQDSLAEHLYQGVIRCHLALGRTADALRVFRRCRDQLSIVLGVPPSDATIALIAGAARP